MCINEDFKTWAVEAGQQVAVGGRGVSGQRGERRCSRGKLGQLGGKVSRKRGSSFTEKQEKKAQFRLYPTTTKSR